MTLLASATASGNSLLRGLLPDADVATCVRLLLSNDDQQDPIVERRRLPRYAYPHLVLITPLLADGSPQDGPPIVGIGKQLSEGGLGFFHPTPLPQRRVIASLELGVNHWLGFFMDLRWCRFMRFGWYESGGRFLQMVESPINGRAAELSGG